MSFVDDFDLSNYETVEELKEARSAIRSEISVLNQYVAGINDKLIDTEESDDVQVTQGSGCTWISTRTRQRCGVSKENHGSVRTGGGHDFKGAAL